MTKKIAHWHKVCSGQSSNLKFFIYLYVKGKFLTTRIFEKKIREKKFSTKNMTSVT